MSRKSIILVGGPDSGKSNYVGRLWASVREGQGALRRAGMPKNIEYVESICEHLLKGEFAGRTDRNSERQDFSVPLKTADGQEMTELVVPDFTGELWLDTVKNSEIPREWLDELERADGALLFMRVHSKLNVQPLDWVTARDLLRRHGDGNDEVAIPTQVVLCELLRLLRSRLSRRGDGRAPRVAVVVAAWDNLDEERRTAGPMEFLSKEFPLFSGVLEDLEEVEVRVYGVSIVGGDLQRDAEFREKYWDMDLAKCGSVMLLREGTWQEDPDVTLPVAWAIGD